MHVCIYGLSGRFSIGRLRHCFCDCVCNARMCVRIYKLYVTGKAELRTVPLYRRQHRRMYVCMSIYVYIRMYVLHVSGKVQLPLLIDANTDAVLHAEEIVPYLWETYGPLLGEIDVTVVEAKNLTGRPQNKRGGACVCVRACARREREGSMSIECR